MTDTFDRVPRHTSDEINRRIQEETRRSVRHFASRPDEIPRRIGELKAEWDIERAIEANASALAFTGTVLGATGDRRWFAL